MKNKWDKQKTYSKMAYLNQTISVTVIKCEWTKHCN